MAGFTFDEFLGNGGASVGSGKGFTFDAFLGGGKKEEPVEEPVADEGIVGKAQTLMTGEEARSAGNMGGITKSAIEAQMNGGPTAYADDGSVKNWLGNLWNAVAYNTSGKLTARNAEMNNQDILRGTVRKNGQEIPLTELDDGELDYLADAAGWNGAGAYFKRFLGPWAKPGNGLLQEWDRTEGVKYADEAERKAARVRYAQDIARMNVEQQESERNAAATELEERPKSFGAGAVGGLVTNGAYMLPFMMPGAHGVLAGVIEGLDRAQELLSDRYETDEDGNIRVGAERDSTERAIVKGAARGVIAPLIETVGGEIVAKGLGKAASMTIGKVPLFQKVGGKIAESAAGKAVSKWIESMSRFGKYTGLQSMPVEIIEELEDQVIDAATALDKRDSETEGDVLGRAAGAFADFMKPQSLLDLTESMLLIQMIGGGAAAASDRARARVPDLILERVAGLKKSEIKNYTPEEKWAAYKSYVDKLSEEEIAEKFGKGAKAVNELTAIIRKGASFDTKKSIEEYGETPHEFEAQTEIDAEGKATPKFRKSVHTGVDGVEREVDEMFDETAQVGIADLGEGKYEVRDAMHPDRTRTTDDFNDAVSTANEWALDNQKRRLDNRVKRELAEQLTQGEDAPFKNPAVFADTVRDVYAAFEAGLRNAREAQLRGEGDGTFMGMQSLGQIFQTDENGEVAMPPRFRAGDEAFTAHDGTKVVVLDNVRDAAHLRRLLSHEAGHSAGRGDPKARVEMLKRISPNSGLGREIARELALNKKLGEKYTEEQVREEAFANWLEARGHNPSIMQRITNKVFGKVGQLNDADLEVMAAKLEAEEANGSGEGVMFLDADYADEQSREVEQAETPAAPTEAENLGENSRASSGAQEEANDETGRGADEEQAAKGEEGAERGGQREEAQAGEGPAEVPEAAGEKADERVVEASAEARQPKSETRKKVEEKAVESISDREGKIAKAAEIISEQVRKKTGDKNFTADNARQSAESLVKAIEDKNADALRNRFNGLNQGSVKAFEALTGLKMPRTQKGQHEVVDRFCGISPEERAKIDRERAEARQTEAERRQREQSLKDGEEAVKKMRVQLPDGKVATVDELVRQGWTVEKSKRGAANYLRVERPDGGGYFRFNETTAYDYLKKLEEEVRASKPKPDGKGKMVKPAAPRTPSIKMKDEAAEKEVQRLEDEFAALFKTPEFDILDGDGREGTVKASYTLDEDRLGGALGFGRGSIPDRAMVDAARVVLGSQVPGAEASALVWNGKITMEAAQGLFSAFNTDAEVGRLFARVFPVAQALGVEYSLEQYTGRRGGDPKGMPLGYYEKGKVKLFSNVLFRKKPQIFASTILHETIHGVSAYALDLVDGTIKNPKAKITPELRAAAQEVIDIYEANKGWMSGYGATNAQEMLAEIANPKFREELKKGGVWQRLWAAIGRMFGFGTKTAYDRAVDALGKFVENYDREVHDSYMKDANRASLDEDLLAANAKYLNWAKKWRLDPEKEKNQKEWARKNGVSFKDPEFDPDTFQRRAGAMAKLVKAYKDGGAADFKTLATRLAENFPEKFGAMKPHLRGLWNYIAEQMGLEEVSKQQADEIYGIIQGQTTEVENDRRRVRREVSEGESTPGGSGPVGLAEGQPASAGGERESRGLLAGGRVRGQDTDGRVDGGRTGAVPGRAQGVAEEEASGGEETRGGEASGGNGTVADSVRPDVGEREASRDSSEDGRGSGAKVKKSAKKAADSTKANPFRRDFVMTKAVEEAIVEKSPIKRIQQNVAAIKLIRELAQKEFVATPDEQATLAKYVGWGGLSEMFTWDYERAWNLERDGAAKSEVESIARKGKFGVAGYEAYKELRQTLNDDEYRSARASTTTAFYTPIGFVRVLHDALRNIGVKGGRFLGPSAGTGNFASAEGEYEKPVNWQFVEKDQVTGMILKALFPNQRVNISGFEETKFPDGFFDFAVDNVPYADVSMTDRSLSPQSFKIHDYFFAKTLAKLRTGGVMAFLTSTGTLDKTSPILRKFLTEHGGRIVGAVRLPNGFFSENAGTDVASDLVIVQKVEGRPDNSAFEKAVEYGKTTEWVRRKGQVEKPLTYNGYFKENPGQVVGKMEVASGQFGPTIKYTMPEKDMLFDIGGAIARAFDGIDKDALLKSVTVSVPEERAPVYDDEGLRQGNITLKDGKPYIKSGEMLEPVSMPNDRTLTKELAKRRRTGKQIVEGLIDLRKAMRGVIDAQMRGIDDEGLKPLLATLNETYDGFVKKDGTLHDKWVMPFVMLDKADGNRMLALERTVKDESGKSKVVKSDIFTKRVISLGQRATKAGSPREALIISYSETGGINIPRIAELLDMDGEEAVDALKKGGDVFENPQTGLLEPSWAYLSGRVRAKLAAARAAVEAGEESFRANVEALEKVQPPMVKLEDTEIKFGATWVDTECMKDFLKDAFGSDYMRITLAKSELTGDWHVEFDRVMNESPWGETSWGAQEFIKRVLNHGSMEHIVTDPVNKKKYLDEKRTEANKLAADKLHSAFSQFILSSDKWAGPMYERYNAVMTDNVAIKLPNNILPFRAAGMSEETLRMLFEDGDTSKPKKGREYQSDVIARGVLGGNSLCLAHCVGAGKTLEMQAIGMLGRRLGMFKKSMYVVPNHMLDQFVNEFTRAFPDANLLKMTAEDVKPANRRAFFAQVANGDWDAIVVKHSTFSQKLGMSKQYQEDFMIQQKNDLMMAITAMKVSGDRISVKQGEKMLARLEDKLKKLGNAEGKDKELVPFEELGVDQLFVDEAHNFKGMPITTRQGRTSGLSGSDSQRAEDMHMKTQYVQSLHGGTRGVVFATGTPLSNAPVIEAYVMLKYLAPQKLAEQGLSHFDDFVAAFGRITVESKFDLDGKSVKEKDAVTAFVNIPEMMNLFKSVVDIVNSDQLNIPRPKPKYHMIDVDMTDAQAKIMEMVAARSSTPPSKEERNKYLTLTRIAKAACLTPRLLGFEDGGNKIVRAVSEVKKVYDDTADNRGTQLIFTDIFNESGAPENARYLTELRSVLKGSSGSTDFNLNEEIRDLLVAAGIPKDEIAIIQDIDKSKGDKDANKEALFAKVRAGEVRILIGSRQKMGEGTNVQERLAAIHLLHPGWKPSEDEQAIGRIIRNGNMFKEGQIFYYLTKGNEKIGSYETKNHQLIGAKSKLIDQVMHNDESVRSVEMDESAMDREMLMGLASGNKALMELIDVKKRAHKLELNTESTLTSARRNKDKAEANARVLERRREEFAKEQEGVKEWREKNDGKPFVLTTPDGRTIEKVKDMAELVAGEVTKQLTKDRFERKERTVLGSINGVEMVLAYDRWGDEKFKVAVPLIGVEREINYSGFVPDFTQGAMTAFKTRILETVKPETAKAQKAAMADMERQAKKMSADADKLQKDYEAMRGDLVKLRRRQAELERAVTPLMVQAVEDRSLAAYGNWAIHKDRVDAGQGLGYTAVREKDGKRVHAPSVKELIPLMDAEDFASPGSAAAKTEDLQKHLPVNEKGERARVDTMPVEEVNFKRPEFDILSRHGETDREYIERVTSVYPALGRKDARRMGEVVAASAVQGALQGMATGERLRRPLGSTDRRSSIVIGRTTAKVYVPLTDKGAIDDVLRWRFVSNIDLFGDELGVRKVNRVAVDEAGDAYVELETDSLRPVRVDADEYFTRNGWTRGGISSGYDGLGPVFYEKNGVQISTDELKFVRNDKTGRIVPFMADIYGRKRGMDKRANNAPVQEALFKTPELYTGSAADFDKPSLAKVGTGQGSQVYGWGLYATTVRDVAEGYKWENLKGGILLDGVRMSTFGNTPYALVANQGIGATSLDNVRERLVAWLNGSRTQRGRAQAEEALEFFDENRSRMQVITGNVYEQTFFTDRAPGDESHLLKWYEPVTEEQKQWIADELNKSEADPKMKWVVTEDGLKLNNPYSPDYPIKTGADAYQFAQTQAAVLAKSKYPRDYPRLASELLARAGIDGIKYPVDSYGKTVKDGNKVGWNYVSFRDDNIRVDHKWRNGEAMFKTPELDPAEAEYAEREDKTPTEKDMRDVFGMTKAEIELAVKAAGLEPNKGFRKSDETTWKQAETLLSNPTYMEKLSRAAYKVGRPLRDYERDALAVLLYQRQAKVNELAAKHGELAAIPEEELKASPEVAAEKNQVAAALAKALQDMNETATAMTQGGAENARALRAHRTLLNKNDLSFAGISNTVAEAYGGADKIPAEVMAEIAALAKKFNELDAKGREVYKSKLKAFSDKIVDSIKNGLKMRSTVERRAGDEAKRVTRNYNDALAQFEVGAVEFGGSLVGHTDQQHPGWGKWLRAIGEYHCFENPNITEEEVIKAIVEDLKSVGMDAVDENQVRNALTGFGHNFRQSRYDSQRLMNDLKSQSLKKLQLKHMDETGTLPPSTGLVRDEPSDETRNLAKQVQAKKAEIPDAERDAKHLKGVLDSAKTRVRNRIADMERAIETGERIPRRERSVVEDVELQQLKKRKAELQAVYDEMFKTESTMTEAQRIAAAEKALGRTLEAAMEDLARAQAGDFSKRPRREGVTSTTIEVLRDRVREVRESIMELKRAKYEFGMTPDEVAALNARKIANREKAMMRLAEKIERGDTRTNVKPQPPMTKEQQAIYDELAKQMKKGRQKLADMRLAALESTKPDWWLATKGYANFLVSAQRALRATMDFSAVLRQAARITLSHPTLGAKAFGKAWEAAKSEANLVEVNDAITADPLIQEAVGKYGLHLREIDAENARDVEMFHGMERNRLKLFGKEFAITDIPWFGELMLKSERHYLTYLNAVSAEMYTAIVSDRQRFPGGATPWQKKMVADMINVWNGSAAISKQRRQALQKAGLNLFFWAPQLAISRIQSAAGFNVWHPLMAEGVKNAKGETEAVSSEERRTLAKIGAVEYVRSTTATLALGFLLRWLFSDDDDEYYFKEASLPEKLIMLATPKIGNTTIDLSGGEASVQRLIYQIVAQEKRSNKGRLMKFGEYGSPTVMGVLGRFAEGKLAPWASTAIAMYTGKDYVGQEFTWKDAATNLAIPLSFDDIKDQFRQNGFSKSLVTAPLTILGAGGSTYDRYTYDNAVNRFLENKDEYGRVGRQVEVLVGHVRKLERKEKEATDKGQPPNEVRLQRIADEKERILKLIRENRK